MGLSELMGPSVLMALPAVERGCASTAVFSAAPESEAVGCNQHRVEIASIDAATLVPEPSRRESTSGSSTGLPLGLQATAGLAPAQACTRAVSPLRNR